MSVQKRRVYRKFRVESKSKFAKIKNVPNRWVFPTRKWQPAGEICMYHGEKERRRSGRKDALHGMVAPVDSAMPNGNDLAVLTDFSFVGRDGLEQHGCVFNSERKNGLKGFPR